MCFILVAYRTHPDYPLVVAANRDEYLARAARSSHWWPGEPAILAGQDLEAGGAWFGVRRDGRVAAVTNLRMSVTPREDYRSRGELVVRALAHRNGIDDFDRTIESRERNYKPFNILYGDVAGLYYHSSEQPRAQALDPGLHAIGNAPLGTPWPKLVDGLARFAELIKEPGLDPSAFFELLEDRSVYDDERLPDTGLPRRRERALSAIYIDDGDYGTRCSTIYTVDKRGRAEFLERHHAGEFIGKQDSTFRFDTTDASGSRG